MEIKFLVRYMYRPAAPENERFKAEVTVFLPKSNEKDYKDRILPCYRGNFGHEEVRYDSGIERKDSREVSVFFYAGSLEKLDDDIENAVEDYRRQVVKNIEVIKKIKERGEKEIIKNFPDPIEGWGIIESLPLHYD